MKITAQPHNFAFQTQEQFFEKYIPMVLGSQYPTYQELKTTLTPTEINLYEKDKKTLEELTKKKQEFIKKVSQTTAIEEDYIQQQQTDDAIKAISLDDRITQYFTFKEKISTPCHRASIVRSTYIQEYNPKERKILIVTGQAAPTIVEDIANILRADGGIVKERGHEIEENETFQDMIYCSNEICGSNNGKETWPILYHAEKNDGHTLFFLNASPLSSHCQNDPELKFARELREKGKKILIIGFQYGRSMRF